MLYGPRRRPVDLLFTTGALLHNPSGTEAQGGPQSMHVETMLKPIVHGGG